MIAAQAVAPRVRVESIAFDEVDFHHHRNEAFSQEEVVPVAPQKIVPIEPLMSPEEAEITHVPNITGNPVARSRSRVAPRIRSQAADVSWQNKVAKIESLRCLLESTASCESRAELMKLRTTEGPWQNQLNNAILDYYRVHDLPTPSVIPGYGNQFTLPQIYCTVDDISYTSLRSASFELYDGLQAGLNDPAGVGRVLERVTMRWFDYNDPRNSYDTAYGSNDRLIRSFCDGVMGTFKLVLKTLFPVGGHIIVATMNHMQKRG